MYGEHDVGFETFNKRMSEISNLLSLNSVNCYTLRYMLFYFIAVRLVERCIQTRVNRNRAMAEVVHLRFVICMHLDVLFRNVYSLKQFRITLC